MEKETSNAVMIGVVLIALAAVIGLSFSIFVISKQTSNEGMVDYQSKIDNFENLEFSTYNDTMVYGRDVKTYFKSIQGKDYCLLVNTTRTDGNRPISYLYDRVLHQINGELYVNYGNILSHFSGGELSEAYSVVTGGRFENIVIDTLKMKDGYMLTDGAFIMNENGYCKRDDSVADWNKAEATQYIADNTKFSANLIKDASGVVIGVCFTQMNRN